MDNSTRVIAFSGHAGSGKTTCANLVFGYFGGQAKRLDGFPTVIAQRISIALPVKSIAETLYGWDGDKTTYFKTDGSVDPTRGRGLLENIGESLRGINPDVFIKNLLTGIRSRTWAMTGKAQEYGVSPPMNLFIVEDLRYKNEAVALRETFGARALLVRVSRKDAAPTSGHRGEHDLDDWDDWNAHVRNDGGLEALAPQVHDLIAKYTRQADAQGK